MMLDEKLKNVDSHFAFGKNWASYANLITEHQVEEAKKGLLKLISAEDFVGASFLDIGCGSGLHALGAAQLGARQILAVDIDPDSVVTTKALLSRHDISAHWKAESISVFDLEPEYQGRFDIVYSWGVLHHTGDMWEAINKAAAMVAPDGVLALALYRKTHLDAFLKLEKRLYAHAPMPAQAFVRGAYLATFRLNMWMGGAGSLREHVAKYSSNRGMDFYHDVHDWLGGYPYESTCTPEVDSKLTRLGFKAERVFDHPVSSGILGSECDEYVYRIQVQTAEQVSRAADKELTEGKAAAEPLGSPAQGRAS